MTCVPGVTRGAREGQKETACIIGCVMCEQRRKSWVFTCSFTFMFMLSRERERHGERSVDSTSDQRTHWAGPPLSGPRARPARGRYEVAASIPVRGTGRKRTDPGLA